MTDLSTPDLNAPIETELASSMIAPAVRFKRLVALAKLKVPPRVNELIVAPPTP